MSPAADSLVKFFIMIEMITIEESNLTSFVSKYHKLLFCSIVNQFLITCYCFLRKKLKNANAKIKSYTSEALREAVYELFFPHPFIWSQLAFPLVHQLKRITKRCDTYSRTKQINYRNKQGNFVCIKKTWLDNVIS